MQFSPSGIHDRPAGADGSSSSARYLAGADIGGTNLRVALADEHGAIVSRWNRSTVGVSDAETIVSLIREGVDQMLDERSASRDSLLAIAAGAPGVTDADRGIVIATSYLLGWRDVPLRAMLESALGAPAFIDNDVNMAAFGEARGGAARSAKNFVFLAIGTGVGAGIVLNGELIRGDSWRAGEVGYMMVPGTSTEPVDPGKPGPLEAMVGGEGIRSLWRSRWSESATALSQDLDAAQIISHAQDGHALAEQVVAEATRTLAYGVCNLAMILNCRLFIFGGGVGLNAFYIDATRKHVAELGLRSDVELVTSELGSGAQMKGAVLQAREIAIRGSVAALSGPTNNP